jgi:uncharacterized membrane protein
MPIDIQKQKEDSENIARQYLQKSRGHFEETLLESPHDIMIEEHSEDTLLHWLAPEFETYEKSNRWYLIASLIIAAIVIYAIITNSLIMAITFILIGVVGYIYLQKEPRILDFSITHDGIVVGREIYDFDNIKSFWIFYEPQQIKVISLHMKGKFLPYVHIPIHDQDPVQIRAALLKFIPEMKQELTAVDAIERLLHL